MPLPLIFSFLLLADGGLWDQLLQLALTQESQGRLDEAEKTLQAALDSVHAPASPRPRAILLNNLGAVQLSRGGYLQAETALKHSLAFFRQDPDSGTDWTAPATHLAQLYRLTGRLPQSEQIYRRVLEARSKARGDLHPTVARSHANLAAALMERRKFREAAEHLEEALHILSLLPGGEGDRASALMNLAVLRASEGDLHRAVELAAQGVALLETSLYPGHPSIGSALHTLGGIHLRLGQYATAESFLRRSIAILRIAFPSGHPALAEALFTNADALRLCGRKREAKLAAEEAAGMAKSHGQRNLDPHRISLVELTDPARR